MAGRVGACYNAKGDLWTGPIFNTLTPLLQHLTEAFLKALVRQYGIVTFAGIAVLAYAFGVSAISGRLLGDSTFLAAMRALGIGLLAAGGTLWTAARREEAGKPELNPLLVFVALGGILLLLAGALASGGESAGLLSSVGLGVAAFGLAIAVLITLTMPAFKVAPAQQWPAGGEPAPVAHHHEEPGHAAQVEASAQDDLTRIEGIGPKLQEVLYGAGIATYAALAAKSADEITAMVKAGGFKSPFNAGSWPQQAALAAKGDWDALKALQDQLTGGRN